MHLLFSSELFQLEQSLEHDCVNHVPPPGRDHKILARGQPQFRPEAEGRGRN